MFQVAFSGLLVAELPSALSTYNCIEPRDRIGAGGGDRDVAGQAGRTVARRRDRHGRRGRMRRHRVGVGRESLRRGRERGHEPQQAGEQELDCRTSQLTGLSVDDTSS